MQLKVPSTRRMTPVAPTSTPAPPQAAATPPTSPATDAAGPSSESTTPIRVGIVCVHGIGFQHPGQTLLEWTGPIATALVGWRSRLADADLDPDDAAWPHDLIESTDVDLTGERPSYVTFRVPGVPAIDGATSQRWTFTEAYWAAKVEPPTLRLLIDWTGRQGVVGRVVQGILGRNAPPILQGPVRIAGELWLGVFVSALTSLVLLGYAILRSILAILPIPAARDFVAYGQGERFLVGWWGDARSLVRDPVQSATVRRSLDDAIADLRSQGCERIVVIAHSGGTIVAYMTLSDPALMASVDTLITHGQAIELGRRLEGLEPDRGQPQLLPSVSRILPVAERSQLRVGRWRDFYGSHDPAPFARPSDLDPATAPAGDAAMEITNLRSIRDDHGAYWANDESFVLPVMAEIERAAGAGTTSRFGRDDPGRSDRDGVRRRESRVAMRSLWGRLALVGPLVAIFLAAGITGGDIGQAAVLDAPSDVLAANYDALPLHDLGTSVHAWTTESVPNAGQDLAGRLTRGLAIVLIAIAALWACIPVGGWSRLPSGAVIADALTSAVVLVAAWAAIFGLGAIRGVDLPPDTLAIAAVALAIVVVSYAVYRWRAQQPDRRVPATLVSTVDHGRPHRRRRGRVRSRSSSMTRRAAGSWTSPLP